MPKKISTAPSAKCYGGCGTDVDNENEVCSSCNAGPGLAA